MRRLKSLGLWLVAAAIGLGSFVATPQVAKAEVYIGLPRIGIYIGDGGRHGPRYHRPAPRRYAYQHYGPPRHYRRAAPRRHWRRHHHSGRHAPRWRSHGRGHGGHRGNGAYYR